MIHELHELLSRVGARVRSLRLWASLAVCWLFWGGVVWAIAQFATPDGRHWPAVWAALAGALLLTALVCWAAARRAGRDAHAIARRVEQVHPELGAMLLAALETAPSPRFKRLGYLQATVVRGAVAHGRQHDWSHVTSPGRLRLAKTANLLALVALGSACLMLADRTTARGSASRGALGDNALRGAEYAIEVEPGDAEIERGTTLVVLAKFRGPLPADADLVIRQDTAAQAAAEDAPADSPVSAWAAGAEPADVPAADATRRMTRSLDDPQFVARVPNVTSELSYHVEFAGQRSPSFRITVFDYPELQRADAELNYPAYTQLEPKVIEDVRQVTAVEGTRLTLKFRLNKEVASARLVDRDGEELPLARAQESEPVYQASYDLARSQRFKLHLTDHQERANKLPPDIVVNVTPNKPAAIKLAKPAKDVRVSPLEELQLVGEVTDDFGVTAYGMSYAIGGAEPTELVLSDGAASKAGPSKAATKVDVKRLIDFESLQAEPDQLVSYYLWAEDLGPDGNPRRTHSDMYFAEVRHFEEIFREGEEATQQQQREQQQQQQQGQQGAGQQAQELAELQKQVVNATWTLIRRETGAATTPEFTADATAVQEAQQQAIDQLAELGQQLSDEQSQQHAARAQQHMEEALKSLATAAADISPRTLRAALSAEQAAYQALLKLRAREFNVARQQAPQQGAQSGAPAGGNSASQQQLQQLELSADENRYETQSRAAAANQQNAQQLEESRQILNRLAELARRQQDLNERLRELQSALEQAETAAEREELQRQLKRLRDQQQDVLRDAESLDNQMQASPNSQQMQESAEQLSETRSRVQQASEALSEGQVSQAITEGTRAERQLSQLRDDFRRQTADRFTEQMRSLRDAARQLDERQESLGEQLDAMNADGRRSLRDAGPRQEIVDGLQQQQRELESTLETMRQTVTEAEEPEPLLAGQLYDAVQGAAENQTAQALDVARQLTEAGGASEATEAMQQAGRGVQQLREQIDRAAESVLGDETEALRRADQRLRELAEQLDEEISRATGRPGEGRGGETSEDQAPGAPGDQPGGRSGAAGEQGEQPGEGAGEPAEGEAGEASAPGEGESEERPDGAAPGSGAGSGDPTGNPPSREERGGEGAGEEGEAQARGAAQDSSREPGDADAGREGSQNEAAENEAPGNETQPGEGEPGQEQTGEGEPRQGGGGQNQRGGVDGQPAERPGAGEGSAPRTGQPGNEDEARPGQSGQAQPSENPSAPNGNAGPGGRNNRGGGNGRGGGALDRIGEFQDALGEAERAARGPITGEDFRQWSDGMREVEDMLDDPDLGAEAARIRDRAERARADYVRQSKSPDWDKLVDMVADPLAELRVRIAEEIRRKEAPDALAPVDRDAAPAEFAEEVRLYYQRLGSGE